MSSVHFFQWTTKIILRVDCNNIIYTNCVIWKCARIVRDIAKRHVNIISIHVLYMERNNNSYQNLSVYMVERERERETEANTDNRATSETVRGWASRGGGKQTAVGASQLWKEATSDQWNTRRGNFACHYSARFLWLILSIEPAPLDEVYSIPSNCCATYTYTLSVGATLHYFTSKWVFFHAWYCISLTLFSCQGSSNIVKRWAVVFPHTADNTRSPAFIFHLKQVANITFVALFRNISNNNTFHGDHFSKAAWPNCLNMFFSCGILILHFLQVFVRVRVWT